MKKLIFVFISVLFITGCSFFSSYDEISYNEFKQMIRDNNSFILFVGSSTCSACGTYKVTLNKVIKKYNVDVKYIDLSKLSEKESGEFSASFPISATPTTIFIEKGKERDTFNRIVGSVKYSKIINTFKENGYIKGWYYEWNTGVRS